MAYLRYGLVRVLENATFEDTIGAVTGALQAEGFGILGVIDIQQTLKDKLGVDFRRYTILSVCHPELAKQALDAEPQIGLLLPCNVVVQEAPERGVVVSIADPRALFTLVETPGVLPVAKAAGQRLRRVIASLK